MTIIPLAFPGDPSDESSCMKHAEKYESLAKLTALPNLAMIGDPERLKWLAATAANLLTQSTRECPLRYKVACREYAEAATYRLENPEEIE